MQRVAVAVGVANQRSLAWKSALSMLQGNDKDNGFDHVIITYQNERFESSVRKMVDHQNAIYLKEFEREKQFRLSLDSTERNESGSNNGSGMPFLKRISSLPLDVAMEEQVQSLFDERIPSLLSQTNADQPHHQHQNQHPRLDALVHSVAYAPPSAMKSSQQFPLLNTDQHSFEVAHSISSYSLISLARHALPLLSCQNNTNDNTNDNESKRSPSITTMTYLGSNRPVPNYNIMGPAKASLESLVRGLAMELSPPPHNIRVNAVSAGPVQTLAARGIRDFGVLKKDVDRKSMIQRGVEAEEVGDVVAFIAGPKASGVTGQVWFVDGGYSSLG